MGGQIIQQPDGRYAVWSSIVNDFVLLDATPEQIIEGRVQASREGHEAQVRRVIKKLAAGEKPYFQFTMTWEEACAWRDKCHKPSSDDERARWMAGRS
ncbi:MAG: hypothetical protein Q8Q14_10035 [Gemmatimonadales bacterium]|nr:hypothetical protein [Gemmatimonadales bacterium]